MKFNILKILFGRKDAQIRIKKYINKKLSPWYIKKNNIPWQEYMRKDLEWYYNTIPNVDLIARYKLRMLETIEKIQEDIQIKYCRRNDRKIKEVMLKEVSKTREEIISIFMDSWYTNYKFTK